jgi:hypothetical protein
MSNEIPESLFYSGGTITIDDIIETTHNLYNVAFNDDYVFIFILDNKLLKVIKYEMQYEYAYRVLKTKLQINHSFKKMLTDPFWKHMIIRVIDELVNVTKAI